MTDSHGGEGLGGGMRAGVGGRHPNSGIKRCRRMRGMKLSAAGEGAQ